MGRISRLAVLAAVLFAAGCGAPQTSEQVDAYCAYGAKSEAQWQGCRAHVTDADVERAKTAAGRCARSEQGGDCGGAGPLYQKYLDALDAAAAYDYEHRDGPDGAYGPRG